MKYLIFIIFLIIKEPSEAEYFIVEHSMPY